MVNYHTEKNKQKTTNCCIHGIAQFVLFWINLAFLVLGAIIICGSLWIYESEWLDMYQEHIVKIRILQTIVGFGVLIILIAFCGCCGALSRNSGLLWCYNIFIVFSVVFFLIIAVASFSSVRVAANWESRNYPSEQEESDITPNFNKIYCISESAYFCNNVPAQITAQVFFGQEKYEAVRRWVGTDTASIRDICMNSPAIVENANISDVCAWWDDIKPYKTYNEISVWINKDCYPTDQTAFWCRSAIQSGCEKSTTWSNFTGSPYDQCRLKFLSSWQAFGRFLCSFFFSCVAFTSIILMFTCCLQRNRRFLFARSTNSERAPLISNQSVQLD